MGRRGITGLKTRVRRECCINRGRPDSAMEVYKMEESKEEDRILVRCRISRKSRDKAEREALGVRAT